MCCFKFFLKSKTFIYRNIIHYNKSNNKTEYNTMQKNSPMIISIILLNELIFYILSRLIHFVQSW